MKTNRILVLIPLLIAAGTIIRCWIEIATSDIHARWQHYSAILFLAVTIFFFFKPISYAVIAVGAFLLLGTMNGYSMTSSIDRYSIGIGGLMSPPFNALSFGLLFLWFVLNFVTLVNLHLDEKQRRIAKK